MNGAAGVIGWCWATFCTVAVTALHLIQVAIYYLMGDGKSMRSHARSAGLALIGGAAFNKVAFGRAISKVRAEFARHATKKAFVWDVLRRFGISQTINSLLATFDRVF